MILRNGGLVHGEKVDCISNKNLIINEKEIMINDSTVSVTNALFVFKVKELIIQIEKNT